MAGSVGRMSRETRSDFYPAPIVDQDMRPGVITRLIVFFVVLTGASIVFALFRERLGDPFLLGMLGVLAMIGVGYLFATAIGFVQVAPRSTNDELAKAFSNSMAQGLIVTDLKGRVIYANRAYAEMTGATMAADVKTVEALLSDVPEASAIVYRLASGIKDGQAGDGEFRLGQAIRPGAEPGARWYRLKARTFNVPSQRQPLVAWQIADVSRERAEQERFFLDLQKAIDHLDHAPAGFFAADQEGRVTYINATLAEWLGIDLASFSPGDADAFRDHRRRRHGAGPLGQGRSRRDARHRHRSRPRQGERRSVAGALHAPRQRYPRRRAGAEPHDRAQPHARRGCIRRAARLRDQVHALLQLDADGDRRRRPERAHRQDQRAVPVAVCLRRRPRCGRPARQARHGDP